MNGTELPAHQLLDLTTFETKMITVLILGGIVQPLIFLFGFFANITNIIVYLRLGLKDSISICFFVLSCTDLVCVMILIASDTAIMLADVFRENWRVDGEDLCWFLIYYYGAFYDIGQGITTFIAVQKCWCVALPFRFKNTFTTTRTSLILASICLAVFSIHLLIFSTQDMAEMLDPVRNRTLIKLWTSEFRLVFYSIVGLVSLVYTTTCQVTVVLCLFVLALGLRASSKFRTSTTIAYCEQSPSKVTRGTLKSNGKSSKDCIPGKTASKKKLVQEQLSEMNSPETMDISTASRPAKNTSRKELQALKAATFLSVLFVVCNTFKLLNYYIILCIPEYNPFGRFVHTYMLANEFRITLEALHLSFNMLVYLKFNSRFRSTLYSTLREVKLSIWRS